MPNNDILVEVNGGVPTQPHQELGRYPEQVLGAYPTQRLGERQPEPEPEDQSR